MSDRMASSSGVSKSTRVPSAGGDGSDEVGIYWLGIEMGGVNFLRSATWDRAMSWETLVCVFQTEGKMYRSLDRVVS